MKPLTPAYTLFAVLALAPAPYAAAATPPTLVVAGWNTAQLATASYAILEPQVEGNSNLVSAEQRSSILAAMKRDSAGAIVRRYPSAKIVEVATPGAINVTPTFVAPNSLVPWAKLGGRLAFQLPEGQQMVVQETFGLGTLFQHGGEFVNFMYDTLAKRLP
ncbi:hypothetical protein [Deinococcus sp. QL22]|uniref:hypothetical protein n=1 Tax=Deinococcus sp. QL22 TaxID=2939437 RepID=UPI0020179986|nr:hypothetical protein [Deinococcus sp. QL22]UQN04886.1 hypothetical protein M1R55_08100 [Deinococcus sp. QL22]